MYLYVYLYVYLLDPEVYTILYYTTLHYTILYYTILYYTILYYTILYYTILSLRPGGLKKSRRGPTRCGQSANQQYYQYYYSYLVVLLSYIVLFVYRINYYIQSIIIFSIISSSLFMIIIIIISSSSSSSTLSFHNFKSQNFKSSVSSPKSKHVAYVSILSQISNCQGLGRKNKHEILKTDRSMTITYYSMVTIGMTYNNYDNDKYDMIYCIMACYSIP